MIVIYTFITALFQIGKYRSYESASRVISYLLGEGVEKDENRVFELTSPAGKGGNENAQIILGDYFMYGIGPGKGERKGIDMAHNLLRAFYRTKKDVVWQRMKTSRSNSLY